MTVDDSCLLPLVGGVNCCISYDDGHDHAATAVAAAMVAASMLMTVRLSIRLAIAWFWWRCLALASGNDCSEGPSGFEPEKAKEWVEPGSLGRA